MPDIVTGKVFVDGEKGITATKMNQIISQAVIQPDFVTTKPASSTLDPTDQLIEVKSTGAYAKVTGQQLSDSVATSPSITAMRLRSFNSLGNSTFECDQRNVGNAVANPAGGTFISDRWAKVGSGSYQTTCQQMASGAGLLVPGTNFRISAKYLVITLTGQEASLAAGDYLGIRQTVEGSQMRELLNDVHSVSLLVQSSVAGLTFGVALRDNPVTKSLTKLCTIPTANTWTLITLPNLPAWASGGNWTSLPGYIGYLLDISLACGSTNMSPANDIWQSGNFSGAAGQSNFCASPVNSTFYIGFIQHEPGSVCTTLIDKPFTQNLDECLRYYQKTYTYGTAPGVVSSLGVKNFIGFSGGAGGYGPVTYLKPMAKAPTVTLYNHATGAANSVRDGSGVDHGSAVGQNVGDTGFGSIGFSTALTGTTSVLGHYTLDTGW